VPTLFGLLTLKVSTAGSSVASNRSEQAMELLLLWVGANLDIEELKRAEQSLRESEAKFRDYAETATDWFWEIGPDYKFTLLTENAFGSGAADRNRHGVLGSCSRP
jgi:PAS domain-containing protein